jgi:NitT/TauT family transport system substrate-binding protein
MGAAGVVGVLGRRADVAHAEPPPETLRIRLTQIPTICVAPQYLAEELLRAEGFTDVQWVKRDAATWLYKDVATGEADLNMGYAGPFIMSVDAGEPAVILGGIHIGCYELFAGKEIRALRDLKGKRVSVPGPTSPHYILLSMILANIGFDHRKDIEWSFQPPAEGKQLLAAGKVDAFLGIPPDPQELRAQKVGHVILNSAVDRPWSQYFCCVAAGNRDFVRKHPVATKRALRAFLKAADLCAQEPDRAARFLVDRGFTRSYDYARQTLGDLPYNKWRVFDPTDTVRFFALRLREAGMIKGNPQKLLADGTDWRFFNELRKELKG